MIRETTTIQNVSVDMRGVDQETRSQQSKKRLLPALKLKKVKAMRAEQRTMLSHLFPTPVRLKRLIHDIENNFAKEFASVIGSVDHAQARLAGLLAALKELSQKVELLEHQSLAEIEEHIKQDTRIHQQFENLVFNCAKYSLEEVSSN